MPTNRLLIQTLPLGEQSRSIVPVNTGEFIEVDSDLGLFAVCVYIRNFDGAKPHRQNSLYNPEEAKYLNGEAIENRGEKSDLGIDLPNLRISIKFTPKSDVNGKELLFGNDCPVSVTNYIPTSLISTGLKFFSWAVNPTIKADLYHDKPYIYGLALNSFTKMGTSLPYNDFVRNKTENLNEVDGKIPTNPAERRKYFCKITNSQDFVYRKNIIHYMTFDTNFISLEDSRYNLRIPTFGNRSFSLDVERFANDELNNFNWTVKSGGIDGADDGIFGLCLNFALLKEEDSESE